MKNFRILAAVALILPVVAEAQPKPQEPKGPEYVFTIVKEIPITSIKNQNRSGTCWCFSTLSFLESEIIREKHLRDTAQYPDLSEMFVVHHAYHDRAVKYVRLNGHMGFSAGSFAGDVLEVIREYGIVPQSVYSGMNYGTDLPVQGELDAVLKGYVDAVVKNPNRTLTPVWPKGFDGILDAYLGPIPETFSVGEKAYTPETYRDWLGINPDDYVSITSFTHHPFYKPFVIEVEDNWRWDSAWNVPLDEFIAVIDNALEKGYTVLWGGDVSERGFTRDGLAQLLEDVRPTTGSDRDRWVGKEDKPEEAVEAPKEQPVTQESRQMGYDNKQTTDDHGMHMYGTAVDQFGTKYYLIKNSWGESGRYKGIWYMSEPFVKAKTLDIMVHKDAVPKDIRKKLGI